MIAKKCRNLCNREIKRAKDSYILEQLKIHEKNAKEIWKTLNYVYPSDKQAASNRKEVDNGTEIPIEEVPDFMNQFLRRVGVNVANKLPPVPLVHRLSPHSFDFVLPEIKLTETLEEIQAISIYKSSALDRLPSRLLKDALLAIPHF